jgi:hypothetical protein
MPLNKSKSDAAFKENVRTLMGEVGKSKHVKSREQALAIAYATQRRGKKKGGPVHFQYGGFANPAAAPVSGPETGGLGMAAPPSPMPTAVAAFSPPPVTAPAPTAYSQPAAMPAPPMAPQTGAGLGGLGRLMPGIGGGGQWGGNPGGLFAGAGMGYPGSMAGPQSTKHGGVARGYALGGPPMPWFSKNEARGLSHTGPIPSIVPGRTDRHNVNVRSGSYILPADTISHLGQNNSSAGYAVVGKMFGRGPFAASAPKMGHRMGLPKPPKLQGVMTSEGGARGRDLGTPVPIVAAGGEDALSPEEVAMVGAGEGDIEKGRRIIASSGVHPIDVENGHKILDMFAMKIRKKHISTLKGLPPPAKS